MIFDVDASCVNKNNEKLASQPISTTNFFWGLVGHLAKQVAVDYIGNLGQLHCWQEDEALRIVVKVPDRYHRLIRQWSLRARNNYLALVCRQSIASPSVPARQSLGHKKRRRWRSAGV